MIRINLFTAFLIFFHSFVYSQKEDISAANLLKKTSDIYNSKTIISYNTKYSLYIDYKTKKVFEQYTGIVLKLDKVSYLKIKNTEFVTFDNYGLKISNDEKALELSQELNNFQNSPLSLDSYLNGFSSKIISSNKDYYVCQLLPPKVSQVMFNKIIIYIKKIDYSIFKEEFYFVEKMESKDEKGKTIYTVPRLEITFSKREKGKQDNMLVKKENYYTEKGKDIVLSKKFASYALYKS